MGSRQAFTPSRLFAAVIVAAGCLTQVPAPTEAALAPRESSQQPLPKSLVIAISAEPATLGPFEIGGDYFQAPIYKALHDFLVAHDDQAQPVPRLATERPSLESGSWKVFEDGTMETTWRLRSGVVWQDGVPFTPQDIVFAWKVANDRQVPWLSRAVPEAIDDMRIEDPRTLAMHWKTSYPFADQPDETTLDPVPVHILERLYASDVQGFVNSPYWTREFIGLGPYKLAAWEPGSHLEIRAVDNHYLGRPKLSTITVRFIADPNTLIANLLSGTVDVNTTPTNLRPDNWKTIEEQWSDGTLIYDRAGALQFVGPNLRVPPFGDVRVRRAMTHAIDRGDVVDAQLIPRELIADTFLVPGSDKARRLAPNVRVYDYDPRAAIALLEEVGWRRGSDGVSRNAAGQAFEFEFRSTNPPQVLVIADLWKNVGLQPNIFMSPPAQNTNLEAQANVKGVETSGYFISFSTWRGRVHSSAIPTPE
ncbi:MAG: hypothetical protein HW416_3246, partial [Chloroflexi bacterium]|nr:hypothetical protein [Chloroflexota bacterium]